MFYQIEAPLVKTFLHFQPVIPTFMEEAFGALAEPRRRRGQKGRKRREGMRGDRIRLIYKGLDVFDPARMDLCGQAELPYCRLQEPGFLAVALDQIDEPALSFKQQESQDQTRKSASGTQIEPSRSLGRQGPELRTIQDMAFPYISQSRTGGQVYPARPLLEHGFEGDKPIECFT